MASVIKTCRVCGREYIACKTHSKNIDTFRWQEVACSPECGAIYLRQIQESRKPAAATTKTTSKKRSAIKAEPVEVVEAVVEDPVAITEAEVPADVTAESGELTHA